MNHHLVINTQTLFFSQYAYNVLLTSVRRRFDVIRCMDKTTPLAPTYLFKSKGDQPLNRNIMFTLLEYSYFCKWMKSCKILYSLYLEDFFLILWIFIQLSLDKKKHLTKGTKFFQELLNMPVLCLVSFNY